MKKVVVLASLILTVFATASILSAADFSAASISKSAAYITATDIFPAPPIQAVPDVHTVISEKLIALADGDTDTWYDAVKGCVTMSWQNRTRDGFFKAKAHIVSPDTGKVINYTFSLVAISNCNSSSITGIWDIKKNGVPVCDGCIGTAYGIDGGVGNYFKLYIGDGSSYDEKWHISGYITQRKDF